MLNINVDWASFLERHDMTWSVKPISWNEGAFIGTGTIGAMIYSEEHKKKISRDPYSIDRGENCGLSYSLPGDAQYVDELGRQVGYEDYPHFTKTFKKIVGVSPSDYRCELGIK
jgi:AraC-like DNA-binding protein